MLSPEDTPPIRTNFNSLDLDLAVQSYRPSITKMGDMPADLPVFHKKTGLLTMFGNKSISRRRVVSMPVFPANVEGQFKNLPVTPQSSNDSTSDNPRRLSVDVSMNNHSNAAARSRSQSPIDKPQNLIKKKNRLSGLNKRAVSMFALDTNKGYSNKESLPTQQVKSIESFQPIQPIQQHNHSEADLSKILQYGNDDLPLLHPTPARPLLGAPPQIFSGVSDELSSRPMFDRSFTHLSQDSVAHLTSPSSCASTSYPSYPSNYLTSEYSGQISDDASQLPSPVLEKYAPTYYPKKNSTPIKDHLSEDVDELEPTTPRSLAPPASSPKSNNDVSRSPTPEPIPPANSPVSLHPTDELPTRSNTIGQFEKLRDAHERTHRMEQHFYEGQRNFIGSIHKKPTHVIVDDEDVDSLFLDMTYYSSMSEVSEPHSISKRANSISIANGIMKVIKQYAASTSSLASKELDEPEEAFENEPEQFESKVEHIENGNESENEPDLFDNDEVTSIYSDSPIIAHQYSDSLFSFNSRDEEFAPASVSSSVNYPESIASLGFPPESVVSTAPWAQTTDVTSARYPTSSFSHRLATPVERDTTPLFTKRGITPMQEELEVSPKCDEIEVTPMHAGYMAPIYSEHIPHINDDLTPMLHAITPVLLDITTIPSTPMIERDSNSISKSSARETFSAREAPLESEQNTSNKFKDLPVPPKEAKNTETFNSKQNLQPGVTFRLTLDPRTPDKSISIGLPLIDKTIINNPKSRKNMKSYQNRPGRRLVASMSQISDKSSSDMSTKTRASLPESKSEMKAFVRQRPFSFCLDGVGTDYSYSRYGAAGAKPKKRAATTSNNKAKLSISKQSNFGPGGLPIHPAPPVSVLEQKEKPLIDVQQEKKPRAVSMFTPSRMQFT